MENAYLLFIESNTSGTGINFIKAAQNLGLKTLLLVQDIDRYPWAAKLTDYKEMDTNDLFVMEEEIASLFDIHNIKGIVTSSEYYVYITACLTEKFGLPGMSPRAVEVARDKARMRTLLQKNGLNSTGHMKFGRNDDFTQIEKLKFPIVVKPASGSGSENVILCKDIESTISHLNLILSETHNSRGQKNPDFVVLEEYIDGREFSVEIFCAPEPVAITVVQKHLSPEPYFLEVGHDIPAQLDELDRDNLINEAKKAVRALGLAWGCIHVELRLSNRRPVIIEVNPRLAGGMIPAMINYSYGLDLIDLQIKSAIAHSISEFSVPELKVFSSIRFIIPPRNGKLSEIKNIDSVSIKVGVVNAYTDSRAKSFSALKGDFTDRVGAIMATNSNQKKCISIVDGALKEIVFVYQEGHECV